MGCIFSIFVLFKATLVGLHYDQIATVAYLTTVWNCNLKRVQPQCSLMTSSKHHVPTERTFPSYNTRRSRISEHQSSASDIIRIDTEFHIKTMLQILLWLTWPNFQEVICHNLYVFSLRMLFPWNWPSYTPLYWGVVCPSPHTHQFQNESLDQDQPTPTLTGATGLVQAVWLRCRMWCLILALV